MPRGWGRVHGKGSSAARTDRRKGRFVFDAPPPCLGGITNSNENKYNLVRALKESQLEGCADRGIKAKKGAPITT